MRSLILAPAALLLLASGASAAPGWTLRHGNRSAGVWPDGPTRGLWLSCAGGSPTLAVASGASLLDPGTEQTVVVTVDGVALLQRMRAGPALRRTLPVPDFLDLANRLAKGRRAEVATPAGRFDLPLAGSGKAVAALLAACR